MSSPSSSSSQSPSHPSHPSLLHPSSESSSQPSPSSPSPEREREPITYRLYTGEPDLPHIISLIASELSEPPHLSFLAYTPKSPTPIGVIVCKQSFHESSTTFNTSTRSNTQFKSKSSTQFKSNTKSNARGHGNRGYIAMLSVDKRYRKRGIGYLRLVAVELPLNLLGSELVVGRANSQKGMITARDR
ncbi:hypothetical protein GGU10DRAFT_379925 [Lentinula aff. detonsa]|uniref:N-acetyltransferase domain-containing protein n=1 Tax=Lentinula aff. detonsa TaxID=2804958 RepID=A0AA38KTV0_9AGAR|nr:hypothetical protein GGU10DRAFT_379925 [Lentinula aff. detonsa]